MSGRLTLEILDPTTHDVEAFQSGVAACDAALVRFSRKLGLRRHTRVWANRHEVLGYAHYKTVMNSEPSDHRPYVFPLIHQRKQHPNLLR